MLVNRTLFWVVPAPLPWPGGRCRDALIAMGNLVGPVSQVGWAELGRLWIPGPLLPHLRQPSSTGGFALCFGTAPNLCSDKAGLGLTLLNWQQRKMCASINLTQQGCQ